MIQPPLLRPSNEARSRLYPARTQFDYIILSDLRDSITRVARSVRGRVLDYGCAWEPYKALFKECVSYEGADFSDNPYAKWVLDERGQLPKELTAAFDAVVSTQVLEHVPDVPLYLEECRRVLRPDGHLLLTTHGIWEYHPGPYDLQRWTMEGLIRLVEGHGFETIHCEAITTHIRSLLQQLQLLLRDWRIRGSRALIFIVNLLSCLCARSATAGSDRRSLAICYLYFGRKKGYP